MVSNIMHSPGFEGHKLSIEHLLIYTNKIYGNVLDIDSSAANVIT